MPLDDISQEIDDAVAAGMARDIDDSTLAETTADLLREWGAATVDAYPAGDDMMVEFYTPFPGDQPIRSNISFRDGKLRKATIRYGVLRGKQGPDHPQNDPEEVARIVEAVARAGDPPGGVQVVANFGDDHYDPRPHLLLAWAPFGAHAYGGEQFERELVHEGDEDGVEVSPGALVDYIVRVGDSISVEFADDFADHRPDDPFPAGPPEDGITPQAQRRLDRLERALNDAAAEMGVPPIEQNSYRTEFDRGVVSLAVQMGKGMDVNPSDFIIDAQTGEIDEALVRFENLPLDPQTIGSSEWHNADGRVSFAIDRADEPEGVMMLKTMAAGHVGITPHLEFTQTGDLPPRELADYLVAVHEEIREEFSEEIEAERRENERPDLSDPDVQRRILREAMETENFGDIMDTLRDVFAPEGYDRITKPGPQGPDDHRIDWRSLIDELQSETDGGRGTTMWLLEEFGAEGLAEVGGGNHDAVIERGDYRIEFGGEEIRDLDLRIETSLPYTVKGSVNRQSGIIAQHLGVDIDVEVLDEDGHLAGNAGVSLLGLPGRGVAVNGARLGHMHVDPRHRDKGIGRLLFDVFLAVAAWTGGRAVGKIGEDAEGGTAGFLESVGVPVEELKSLPGGWMATQAVGFAFDIDDYVRDQDWIDVTVS